MSDVKRPKSCHTITTYQREYDTQDTVHQVYLKGEADVYMDQQDRDIKALSRRPTVAKFNAVQEECDGRLVVHQRESKKIIEQAETIKRLRELLHRARPADVPVRTKSVIEGGRLVGVELQAMTDDGRRRTWLNVDIDAALDTKENE